MSTNSAGIQEALCLTLRLPEILLVKGGLPLQGRIDSIHFCIYFGHQVTLGLGLLISSINVILFQTLMRTDRVIFVRGSHHF